DQAWPLGTGPFRFAERPTGERLELVAHPGYWGRDVHGQPLPYADRLVAVTVPVADALAQLGTGGLDLFGPIDRASLGDAALRVTGPSLGWCGFKGLLFPGDGLPADLRRAIARGLDRAALARGVDAAEFDPSDRHLLPEHLGYEPLLADEGLPLRGEPLGRPVVVGAFASDAGLADDVCAQLAALGIPARAARFSSQSLQRVEAEREDLADVLVVEIVSRVVGLDPFPLLRDQLQMIRSTGTPAAVADQLLEQAAATDDRAARMRSYRELERAWRADPRFVVLGTLRPAHLTPSMVIARGVGGLCGPEDRWVGPYPPSFAGVWLER
ncbi:MAG: ABC transporter substrate-binding protein, partial [Myxococcota bacterium]